MYIDSYKTDWLLKLSELWASAEPNEVNYLLIDGAFVPGIQDEFIRVIGQTNVFCLFHSLPSYTALTKQVAPFVISVQEISVPLAKLLEKCSGIPMISTISTTENINALGARLASWCIVECDGQRLNLRYADTRRLPALVAILCPDKLGSLVGPARRWAHISREGSWVELDLTTVPASLNTDIKVLANGQFRALMSDSEPDEILHILRYSGVPLPYTLSKVHQLLSIAISVSSSRQMKLEQKLLWCRTFLMRGEVLDELQAQASFLNWAKTDQ